MQEPVKKIQPKIDSLPQVEMQKLVAAFAWLIEEDKKQNPNFYKS